MNLQILCVVFPLVFTIAYSGPANKTAVSENVNLAKPSETHTVISIQTPALAVKAISGETTPSPQPSSQYETQTGETTTPFPKPNPPYDTPTGVPDDPKTTSTTTTPKNDSTTTPVPTPTTPSTTTPVTPTTAKPTSTDKPTPTTAKPTPTTVAPNVTSTHPPVTTTALPPSKDRKFDGPSFIGGIILALGLVAIGFVSWKFYKARTERNYHTL